MWQRQKRLSRAIVRSILTLSILLLSPVVETIFAAQETVQSVRIGVLAKRGYQQCLDKWRPTAQYLTSEIPDYSFTIVPLGFGDVYPAVEHKEIDFVLANPTYYVTLELLSSARRIVTLKNLCMGKVCTVYGAVIFCRADRRDIGQLDDLRGRSFMAVDEKSLGGWLMAWRKFRQHGLDPHHDFAYLSFGGSHDAVVYAVRDGDVDAGSVRTDTLERMAMEGKIRLQDFRVINKHDCSCTGMPFVGSTPTYPEWPLAKAHHTSDELAEKVAAALLAMPPDSPAAKSAQCSGWTVPQNYQPVHDCLKELRIGLYKDYGKVTLYDVLRRYWHWLLGPTVLTILMALFMTRIARLNRSLGEAVAAQQKELHERKQVQEALQESRQSLIAFIQASPNSFSLLDSQLRYMALNEAALCDIGLPGEQVIGHSILDVLPELSDTDRHRMYLDVLRTGETSTIEDIHALPHIGDRHLSVSAFKVGDGLGIITRDMTERREMELRLRQSERMQGIGELASGIAHEINTPAQYVGDNTRFLQESYAGLITVLQKYGELLAAAREDKLTPELVTGVEAAVEEADLDYLRQEIPRAIEASLEGATRVADIVAAMKTFAHPGGEKTTVDLNKAIETTTTVARNEWKYVADMATELDPSLPLIQGYPGELNQCLLNLIVNAAHAIAQRLGEGSSEKGKITISTQETDGQVEVRVSDTGTGIPPEIRDKIFDRFFTTKEVGKGSGQGLTIAYDVVVNKHRGALDLETQQGQGTTFIIRLPIDSENGIVNSPGNSQAA
ncbi:MAG: PhnD/SsuA/transferrin family substrate-binding protein [Candidatus Eisenbacteria sp.]|nr:PhnD/SsuA/transferrin family substrate-binding protein [Candidatus Eisenbacteria bacterium]